MVILHWQMTDGDVVFFFLSAAVYSLDSIRILIEKKMSELDPRDGYHYIPNPLLLDRETSLAPRAADRKGKGKTVDNENTASLSDVLPISGSTSLGVNDHSGYSQVDSPPLSDSTGVTIESRRGSARSTLQPRTPMTPSRSEGIGDLAAFLRDTGPPDEMKLIKPLAYSKDVFRNSSNPASMTSTKAIVGEPISGSEPVQDRRLPREAVFSNKDGIASSKDFLDFLNSGPEISKIDISRTSSRSQNVRPRSGTLPSDFSTTTTAPIPPFPHTTDLVSREFSNVGSFEIVPRPSQEEPQLPRNSTSLPSDLSSRAKSKSLREMVPREASSQRLRRAARASIFDMAQLMRQGPDSSRPTTPDIEGDLSTLGMISNLLNEDYVPRAVPRTGGSPNNRASKRWTMSGMSSLLRQATESGHVPLGSTASETPFTSASAQNLAVPEGGLMQENTLVNVEVPPLASTPLPPHDFKERALAKEQALANTSLPMSSQMPSEIPPNVNVSI